MRIRACWLATVVLPLAAAGDPLVNQPAGPVGPPASIELELVSANRIRDHIHAQYTPGSNVIVKAVIRDANNNVLDGPAAGCTPVFLQQGTFGGGQGLVTPTALGADTATVTFGPNTGVFSVSVQCQEAPTINNNNRTASEGGHHAPYNFETSNSPFAFGRPQPTVAERVARMKAAMASKPAEPPPVTPATPDPPASKKKGMGVGVLAGALLGGYLIKEALSSDEEADCSCTCTKSKHDCKRGGSTYCRQVTGGDMFNICNCTYPCSPEPRVARTVDELVAAGLARQRTYDRQVARIDALFDGLRPVQRIASIADRIRGADRSRVVPTKPAPDRAAPRSLVIVSPAITPRSPERARSIRASAIVAVERTRRIESIANASVVSRVSTASARHGSIASTSEPQRTESTHGTRIFGTIVSTAVQTASGWLHQAQSESSISVTPWAGPDGGGLTIGGRF